MLIAEPGRPHAAMSLATLLATVSARSHRTGSILLVMVVVRVPFSLDTGPTVSIFDWKPGVYTLIGRPEQVGHCCVAAVKIAFAS